MTQSLNQPTINNSPKLSLFVDPKSVKFKCFGGRGQLCQIDRIEEGLRKIGATESDEPNLVYANDAGVFEQALNFRTQNSPSAKLLFNVLDIPEANMPPNGDFTFEKLQSLGELLGKADAITSISQWTQSQLQRYFGFGSTVIYNPIKDVVPYLRESGEKKYEYKALLVGRTNDPNKRVRSLGVPALIAAGFNEDEVAVVGGEWPGWGTNFGVVSDAVLCGLYNSVDFVIYPSLSEGLGLPAIESMICGAVPIVCSDLTTVDEFPIPKFWRCYPGVASIAARLYNLRSNPELLESERNYCLAISEGLIEKFSKEKIAQNIVNVYTKLSADDIS